MRDIYQCQYCTLRHDDVEAGGIYYCPNPLCHGPGGAWMRHRLSSVQPTPGDRHTVDTGEWIIMSMMHLEQHYDEAVVAAYQTTLDTIGTPEERTALIHHWATHLAATMLEGRA